MTRRAHLTGRAHRTGVDTSALTGGCSVDTSHMGRDAANAILTGCQENSSPEGQQLTWSSAGDTYSAFKDYFDNPPDYLHDTHDEIAAKNAKLYDAMGNAGAMAATALGGPGAGALFQTIWQKVAEPGVEWLGDVMGFNDPLPASDAVLFAAPKCTGAQGPLDPAWVGDPAQAEGQFPLTVQAGDTTGGGIFLESPPFDPHGYVWSFQLDPNNAFEQVAFTVLIANGIAGYNCAPSFNPGLLVQGLIQAWNQTHDGHSQRTITLDSPQVTYDDASGTYWPAQGSANDPITTAMGFGTMFTVYDGPLLTPPPPKVSLTPGAVAAFMRGDVPASNVQSQRVSVGILQAISQGHAQLARGVESLRNAAVAGHAGAQDATASLAAAQEKLLRDPRYWVDYYRAPLSARRDPFKTRTTMSRGQGTALAGMVSEEAARAWADRTKGLV